MRGLGAGVEGGASGGASGGSRRVAAVATSSKTPPSPMMRVSVPVLSDSFRLMECSSRGGGLACGRLLARVIPIGVVALARSGGLGVLGLRCLGLRRALEELASAVVGPHRPVVLV